MAVREMVRRAEAGGGGFLGGCEAVKVDGWVCGVWWDGGKEVFAEVGWGKFVRDRGGGRRKGTGVHGEGQVGDGGDGRNESWGRYVLPVDREGIVRRVCVPRKALEYQAPIYETC